MFSDSSAESSSGSESDGSLTRQRCHASVPELMNSRICNTGGPMDSSKTGEGSTGGLSLVDDEESSLIIQHTSRLKGKHGKGNAFL